MSSPTAGGGASNPFGVQFTPEEEEEFGEMARSDGFYERFAKSVGPSIYGSLGLSRTVNWLLIRTYHLCRHQEGDYLSAFRWL